MKKNKDAPAMLELIQRAGGNPADQLTVPAWMGGGKRPLQAPPVQPPPAEPPPPAAPPRPPRPGRASEKLLTAEGKRLRVSITPGQAIAVGVVAVLVVVAVFVLGLTARGLSSSPKPQGSGGQPPADTSLRATVSPERRELPVARTPVPPAPPPGSEPILVKGKYYLVVQGLMGMTEEHRADAEAIAAFLNGRGEPVGVMVLRGPPRQYIVVSLRGFGLPDSPEAKRYMRAIEEQGKLYRSQGGRYDFRQGESGWFVQP